MFPLGRCVFPGEAVPLRIFEPRYLEMVERVLDGSAEFGIVLISRGWEVGGGDDRFDTATVTRIVRDVPLGDGQRAVVCLAVRRIAVVEWLEDALEIVRRDARSGVLWVGTVTAGLNRFAKRDQTVGTFVADAAIFGEGLGHCIIDLAMPQDKVPWNLSQCNLLKL